MIRDDPPPRAPAGSYPRLSSGDSGPFRSITPDSSIPPPPPPPSSPGRETPPDDHRQLAIAINKARREAKIAMTLATDAHGAVQELVQVIGQSPDPAQGKPGGGMMGTLATIASELKANREESVKTAAQKAATRSGVAWTLGVLTSVVAVIGGLGSLIRWLISAK